MTVADAPVVAEPAVRLAPVVRPALVNGQQVFVECPSWCVSDHVADSVRHLEDLEHEGRVTDLVVPGGPGYGLLAHARLGSDPFGRDAGRGAYVVVDDQSDPFQLSPEEASVFADRLEAFARQVRGLSRVAAR
jgi:hypothetical protein